MAHIIQNRKDFQEDRAVMIWDDVARDGTRCEVWQDQVSTACRVRHFANQAKIKRQIKLIADMRRANYADESNSHFTSKKHDGDRIIAQLISWDILHHPEI
jgi:hypothetical protein